VKVIVDTDVWSEAFRRKGSDKSAHYHELCQLIEEGRVELLSIVKMEILCGIRDDVAFEKIHTKLEAFREQALPPEIYVMAARFFNLCRSKGIQGSNNDFIICAASVSWKLPILSKDKDFDHYKKYIPIELHQPR
jgi:predicted nucleic acid-binding protein